MMKKIAWMLTILAAVCLLVPQLRGRAAAEQPLTKDDVTLLLLGGSPSEKIITLVQQRGIDFQMTPDLAKKFHDSGASDQLIEALQKAGETARTPTPSASAPEPSQGSRSQDVEQKISQTMAGLASRPSTGNPEGSPPAPASKPTSAAALSEPSPDQIQKIIQEFAAKEKLFKQARDNYTYHQINRVQELGPDNEVVGTYTQEWDILYDDAGSRIERVTYAPESTLKGLMVTKEDLDAMRNIQPFVMTTDDLPEYEIKFLGHVQVDQITAYVFSIRPKEIKKGRQYFQGIIWVDDRDLQIVKSEGKQVPEMLHTKKGENLFPRFTTWREQIDGKYWFPTYTMADDTLYFSSGPIHIKEIVRYTNYKQFKAGSRILSVEAIDKSKPQGTTASPQPKQ